MCVSDSRALFALAENTIDKQKHAAQAAACLLVALVLRGCKPAAVRCMLISLTTLSGVCAVSCCTHRALLAEEAGGLSDLQPPAAWWDGEADIALLVGLHRHGLTAFEEVRRDPELVGAFQVGGGGGV